MAATQPTAMTRAKEWSPEAEEAWRFQLAGYRDEHDYKNIKKDERELLDKDIPKCKLYAY
ncbi:MEIG1-like protein [Mya arenaria]|uniref:MEIG1-like protein n=1 Tax=Mya arenaria TaxID=6604 RepID=A0ABY7ENZ8_MYAAR|nr:MEIG1-like protein [Mya arenaria]